MQTPSARATELLVVGAGPVGLFGALCAVRRGLDVSILEQTWQGFAPGYASILDPRSVLLLRDEGIGEDVLAAGRWIDRVSVRVEGRAVAELRLAAPALSIAQTRLEEALLEALRERGVRPRASYQATTIEQQCDGVIVGVMRRELVRLGSPADCSEWQPVEASIIRANFVIGADGYDSRVRAALGIEALTVGKTESFAIFELPTSSESDGIELHFTGGLGSAMVPLANGRARWSFQIDAELDAPPETGRLRNLLAARAPDHQKDAATVDWATVMHFERRLARSFGEGRVWLVGDAAHATSPLGGQSMNGGLFEAHTLACRMSELARGKGGSDTLEHYGRERGREWRKLLGVNVHFDVMPHAAAWVPNLARRIVPSLPVSGPDLQHSLEEIGLRLH